jgi:double-stranded uracil-DNA glycosylase
MTGRGAGLPGIVERHGFRPIGVPGATRLVLGSMPGVASLQAGEYYAHPRNAFWEIAEALFGISRTQPYAERVLALETAGVAVWDVLKACRRSGSLDSAIETGSIVTNDFRRFLRRNPGINRIYFNGGMAHALFERHVLPTLAEDQRLIARFTLPSTSPANARLTLAQKSLAWRVITRFD